MKITKSRTYAVVLTPGNKLGVYFLCTKTESNDRQAGEPYLDVQAHQTTLGAEAKSAIISLLVAAGLTVRFFDPEEQQWMDQSVALGYTRAPGNRDGSWGVPTSVREFQTNYLDIR